MEDLNHIEQKRQKEKAETVLREVKKQKNRKIVKVAQGFSPEFEQLKKNENDRKSKALRGK